eukprot:gene10345-8281_t
MNPPFSNAPELDQQAVRQCQDSTARCLVDACMTPLWPDSTACPLPDARCPMPVGMPVPAWTPN